MEGSEWFCSARPHCLGARLPGAPFWSTSDVWHGASLYFCSPSRSLMCGRGSTLVLQWRDPRVRNWVPRAAEL